MASPEIDAISIAVPPALQPLIARAATENGKHVFCEKPLAPTVPEAERLLRTVKAAGIVHALDFLFPEIEAWQVAKRHLTDGTIGRLAHFSYTWKVETYATRHRLDSWKTDGAQGGGIWGNFMSHVFYNIEWLAGPITEITASRPLQGAAPFCAVESRVRLASGQEGTICVRTDAFLGPGHVMEFYGDEGTLVLSNPTADYGAGFRVELGRRGETGLSTIHAEPGVAGVDGRIAPVRRIAGRFLDAIVTNGKVTPNIEDGFRVQHLLDRAVALAAASDG